MKNNYLLLVILSCSIIAAGQDPSTISYINDTVWLKTGMVLPCKIIADSISKDYVYVNFVSSPGKIEHTRFSWDQIKTIHQQTKPYIPKFSVYRIDMHDGTVLNGRLLAESETEIEVEMEDIGQLTINRDKIKSMIPDVGATGEVKGSFWFENPQSTRYFWSPNSYGLKSGEGYYQNVWVLFNQFAIGLTDNISIGGGVLPFFFFGMGSTPVWFTPKFSIPIVEDKFNVGGGALIGTVLSEENAGFGILYGLTTFGSRDKNLTVGLGYGYAGGSFANSPMININGMIRTGAKGYLLTENYFIPTGDDFLVLISLGGRRIINRSGMDFGLFIPIAGGLDTFIAIPWLGITVPFGKPSEQEKNSDH